MFRGREREHPDRGRDLLMRLAEEIKDIGTIETQPLLEGRNYDAGAGTDEERRSQTRCRR